MTVLGISLGTRLSGVCVLRKDDLLDWGMHSYNEAWSETKLRIAINRYRKYVIRRKPDAIVVKVSPLLGKSRAMRQIVKGIEKLAAEQGCNFDLITKSEIKDSLALSSDFEIVEFAKLLYPALTGLYSKGKDNNHSHYKKVYEAVLAAHVYQERQRVKSLN